MKCLLYPLQLIQLDTYRPTFHIRYRQTATPLKDLLVQPASGPRTCITCGICFFQNGKIPLGFPVPDGVGCKDEVHLFQSPLVRLRVQAPDHGDGDGDADVEDVKGLLVDCYLASQS